MKQAIVIFCMLFWSLCATAQGVKNGGFESHNSGCKNPRESNPSDFSVNPFGDGHVNDWSASHGSPQITKLTCNSTLLDNEVGIGNSSAFIDGRQGVNMEGIFQAVNFAKDESFNFTISSRSFTGVDSLFVELTTGLTNSTSGGVTLSLPSVIKRQVVLAVSVTTTWTTFRVDELVIDDDYDQIWIYGTDGSIFVDGISAIKSCCEPYKVWQNITNPPSTYVNNFIKAGDSVDLSQPSGKVKIMANAGLTEFQAGQHIELLPGFETELGAKFVAEIKDCGEKELEIRITEIDPISASGHEQPPCYKAFMASACYGSGKYTFSWDNGFGVNRTGADASISENIDLNSPQWLFVTAIDEVTNDTIREGFHIPASPFSGSFSIDLFNVITPNGDGLNDWWGAIDSSKLNQDSFGYNAYHYELSIYDRHGGIRYHKSKTNTTKGFAFDEIDWIVDYCNEIDPGHIFGVLVLTNCSQSESIPINIVLICDPTQAFYLNVDDADSHNLNIIVFPNPSSSAFFVESQKNNIEGICILNLEGKRLLKNQNLNSTNQVKVEIGDLKSGNYLVEISLSDGSKSYRRIIVQ